MATTKDTFQWEMEVIDHASDALDKIEKETRQAAGATDDLGDKQKKAGKAAKSQSKSTGKLSGALAAVGGPAAIATAGIAALTAGLYATVKAVTASVSAYKEQFQVDQQLRASIKATGSEVGDLEARFDALSGVIGDFALNTQFGDEQVSQAVTTLQDLTGQSLNAEEAQSQLNVVLGIAAQRGIDASKAAEMYSKAKNGEVTALKRIIPLTKDQAQELNVLEDETERVRIATSMLEEQYGGVAQELNKGFYAALKNTRDAQGDLLQAVGKSITENENFVETIERVHLALRGVEAWVSAGGLDPLIERLGHASDDAMQLAIALGHLSEEVDDTDGRITRLEAGLIVFEETITGAIPAVGFLSDSWDWLTGTAREFNEEMERAERAGENLISTFEQLDSVSDGAMTEAVQKVRDFGSEAEGVLDGLAKYADEHPIFGKFVETDVMTFGEEVAEQDRKRYEDAQKLAKKRQEQLEASRKELALAQAATPFDKARVEYEQKKAEIKDSSLSKAEEEARLQALEIKRQRELTKMRREGLALVKELTATESERIRSEMQAQEVAGIRLDALEATDEIEKARLERKAQLTELEAKELGANQRKLEQKRIEANYESRIAEIKRARDEAEEARQDRIHQKKMDQLREEIGQQEQMADAMTSALGAFDTETGDAFQSLSGDLLGISRRFQEMEAEGKSAEEAMAASASAGGQAIGGFLEQMGVGYREVAAIRATFETAASIAAFASGNIPGGIGHATAAATFAGMAIAGKPSEGKPKSGAGQQGPRRSGPDFQQAFEANKRAYVEAIRETRNEGSTATYIIDQSGSTFLERDPASARKANQTLRNAERNTLRLGA